MPTYGGAYGDYYGPDYSVAGIGVGVINNRVNAAEGVYFGRDILHTEGRFPLSPSGDYVLVEFEENLRLSILRRLLTNPGEYKFRPDYGVGASRWVKKPGSSANLAALRERIIAQISQDPRVERVTLADAGLLTTGVLRILIVVKAAGREIRLAPFDLAGE
jgi:phage baseplate assembly protein W